jgi:hypothetical protein
MTEKVIAGDVERAIKRLNRKLALDGQLVALARLREPSKSQRARTKHDRHLKMLRKGKRTF